MINKPLTIMPQLFTHRPKKTYNPWHDKHSWFGLLAMPQEIVVMCLDFFYALVIECLTPVDVTATTLHDPLDHEAHYRSKHNGFSGVMALFNVYNTSAYLRNWVLNKYGEEANFQFCIYQRPCIAPDYRYSFGSCNSGLNQVFVEKNLLDCYVVFRFHGYYQARPDLILNLFEEEATASNIKTELAKGMKRFWNVYYVKITEEEADEFLYYYNYKSLYTAFNGTLDLTVLSHDERIIVNVKEAAETRTLLQERSILNLTKKNFAHPDHFYTYMNCPNTHQKNFITLYDAWDNFGKSIGSDEQDIHRYKPSIARKAPESTNTDSYYVRQKAVCRCAYNPFSFNEPKSIKLKCPHKENDILGIFNHRDDLMSTPLRKVKKTTGKKKPKSPNIDDEGEFVELRPTTPPSGKKRTRGDFQSPAPEDNEDPAEKIQRLEGFTNRLLQQHEEIKEAISKFLKLTASAKDSNEESDDSTTSDK